MLLGCLHAGNFIYLFFPFPFIFSVGYCRSLPLPCSSYRASQQGGEKSDVIGDVPVPPLFPSFFIGSHASHQHSSVYFSHLFSLRESPTFSSISSDNSFEPLDAFTWNAHQVLSLHGSRKWAARTFFVDRLLPHHRATFVYLSRSLLLLHEVSGDLLLRRWHRFQCWALGCMLQVHWTISPVSL